MIIVVPRFYVENHVAARRKKQQKPSIGIPRVQRALHKLFHFNSVVGSLITGASLNHFYGDVIRDPTTELK